MVVVVVVAPTQALHRQVVGVGVVEPPPHHHQGQALVGVEEVVPRRRPAWLQPRGVEVEEGVGGRRRLMGCGSTSVKVWGSWLVKRPGMAVVMLEVLPVEVCRRLVEVVEVGRLAQLVVRLVVDRPAFPWEHAEPLVLEEPPVRQGQLHSPTTDRLRPAVAVAVLGAVPGAAGCSSAVAAAQQAGPVHRPVGFCQVRRLQSQRCPTQQS